MSMVVDNSVLESLNLDFEFVQPCEHSMHPARHDDQPAGLYVRRNTCKNCGDFAKNYFLCMSGWYLMGKRRVECVNCGDLSSRDERLVIIRVL